MVSAAVACHLPTMILINMRMHHQYYHDMSNRFWNDMNLIANKAVYPEMIGGEVWEGRIADQMAEWFVKPDYRFEFIRKWEYFLKDALCYQRIDRTQVRTRDIILSDGQAYDQFRDPFKVSAEKLWETIQGYETKDARKIDIQQARFQVASLR